MAQPVKGIAERLDELRDSFGARTAITDETGALTYSELVDRVARLSTSLLALGLEPGDRVASVQRDSRQHIESVLALLLSGLVRVPLNPGLTSGELRSQIVDSGARAIIHDSPSRDLVREAAQATDAGLVIEVGQAAPGARSYEDLIAQARPSRPQTGSGLGDLAQLSYSGGTTGNPKAVALTCGNLLAAVDNAVRARPVRTDDIFLNVRPIWPIAGIILLFQALGGASIVLAGKFDPGTFPALIDRTGATTSSLVPTQLVRLLDHAGPTPFALPTLRLIDCGGAAIPLAAFEEAVERFGPRLGVLYGLTEAPWTCYLAPEEIAKASPDERAEVPTSVGKPIPGYSVRIVDEAGRDVVGAAIGEVAIAGDNVMQGYWQKPDETRRALRDGWLHSGDLGRLDDAGRLHVTGRLKEVIRSGAMSVNPREVEDVLLDHPAVAEAAVYGAPDSVWGEVVRAAVVLRAGQHVTAEELISFCRTRLASYKKPQAVEFRDSLPRSHYGKVVKRDLVQDPASSGERP